MPHLQVKCFARKVTTSYYEQSDTHCPVFPCIRRTVPHVTYALHVQRKSVRSVLNTEHHNNNCQSHNVCYTPDHVAIYALNGVETVLNIGAQSTPLSVLVAGYTRLQIL